MVCCFFGHKDAPGYIAAALEREIELLIDRGADCFLVGNQGGFDAMVLGVLRKIAIKYPEVGYKVVLPYMPKSGDQRYDFEETMLPEGIESVHPKYAIAYRNRWMVAQSDSVIVYVAHDWGGAAKYAAMAARKGKEIVNLFEKEH